MPGSFAHDEKMSKNMGRFLKRGAVAQAVIDLSCVFHARIMQWQTSRYGTCPKRFTNGFDGTRRSATAR